MSFAKVETQQVDFPALERDMLAFWQRTGAFEQLRRKNRGKPRWSFLDGPITANNPMGVHHAWGRTYKDAYQRYFAMTGRELRYQNGFDCQGLWVEVEVEKELKLGSKRDIENLVPGDPFRSIDHFVQECKARVDKFAKVQTEQSIRLGYWMDWDREEDWRKPPDERRSYFTMSEENNYTIWSFLKKCHQRGLVYKAYDAMPWCPRCSVGLSQMEMHEGYQLIAHRAVFVRFPLRGRPGESLLVWTTTPWTLTSNVAAAVHPGLKYLRVKHRDEVYYLAEGAWKHQRLEEEFKRKEWVEGVPKLKTLEQMFKEKGGAEVLGELTGAEMIGWEYDGPFDELSAQGHPAGYPAAIAEVVTKQGWAPAKSAREVHRVIAWDMVGAAEGTGIVHIAPGCGKEDFHLGRELGLPPVAPLDEEGTFVPGFGPLEGRKAVEHDTTDAILDNLKQKGVLFAVEQYPHSYPHCWRCKSELLFRLVDEWFIDMKWREEIMRVTEKVRFLPESINGKARELDWLRNMGDWMISKKRFWGLALPVWVDEQTGEFEVIGSRAELKERAVEGWEQFEGHPPHRPWVDLVKIRNPRTGNLMTRIPDVGNPWLDAGIVPYSTMGYNRDRAEWEKWFPADFITECFPGQFRNWFYAILAMSTMMEQCASFEVLLGHGLVRDQWGRPMHKSAGNSIPFEGAADEGYELTDPKGKTASYAPMSADVIRWMFCRTNPAQNINFGPDPADELRSKLTMKLWNTYAFFCNYARLDGFDPSTPQVPVKDRPDTDRWVLSELQLLVKTARREFELFNVQAFCLESERFVDDKLSNWYVRRNKPRFWSKKEDTDPGRARDKLTAYQTLYTVLTTLTRLFAPVMPFLADTMYQNLEAGRSKGAPASVHLCDFPEVDETLIDEQLSADMDAMFHLKELGSAARNTVKIKVRQPLAEMKIESSEEAVHRAIERFGDQLREELNIKKVTLHDASDGHLLTYKVALIDRLAGPRLGPRLSMVKAALMKEDLESVVRRKFAKEFVRVELPDGQAEVITPAELALTAVARDEGWVGESDVGVLVAIDVRLTEELQREGMARELVRHINELRKKANLEMDDRIVLHLATEAPALRKAIETHRDYICRETLAVELSAQPLTGEVHRAAVKVDGQSLAIELRKST